jgi:hypothetical protein
MSPKNGFKQRQHEEGATEEQLKKKHQALIEIFSF